MRASSVVLIAAVCAFTLQSVRAPAGPIAIAPGGAKITVADADNDAVVFLSLPSLVREGALDVGGEPQALAFDAAEARLFVTTRQDAMLTAIDTRQRRAIRRVHCGSDPFGVVTTN